MLVSDLKKFVPSLSKKSDLVNLFHFLENISFWQQCLSSQKMKCSQDGQQDTQEQPGTRLRSYRRWPLLPICYTCHVSTWWQIYRSKFILILVSSHRKRQVSFRQTSVLSGEMMMPGDKRQLRLVSLLTSALWVDWKLFHGILMVLADLT